MKTDTPALGSTGYRMVRFMLCGGLSTAIHWATMATLMRLDVEALWATASGAVTGAVVNYGLQRRITFRYSGPHRRALRLYLSSCIAGWLTNLSLFALLHHLLRLDVVLAQLLTTALATGMNYVLYERLVFND